MRTLRGGNAMAVIAKLNPVIRGWAAYYRGVVSSRVFNGLDAHMWRLLYLADTDPLARLQATSLELVVASRTAELPVRYRHKAHLDG